MAEQWIRTADKLPEQSDEREYQLYCEDTDQQFVGYHIGEGVFQYAIARISEDAAMAVCCRPSHWTGLPSTPMDSQNMEHHYTAGQLAPGGNA